MNAKNTIRHSPPSTLEDAAGFITKIGFATPSDDDMQALHDVCGMKKIGKTLADTLNGENLEESKTFLSGVLGAIAPSTRKRLVLMGLQIPPTQLLVRIGAVEGAEFTMKVREASSGSESNVSARNYIALTLARFQEEGEDLYSMQYNASEPAAITEIGSIEQNLPVVKNVPIESLHPQAKDDNDPLPEENDSVENGSFKSAHVYGGGFALCFNACMTKQGIPSISLDAGVENQRGNVSGSQNKRTYNWANKITVQFTARELHLVYAVMMGYMDNFQGAGHGTNNEKWFTLKKQTGRVFVSVNSRGKPARGVPIKAGDICPVISLLVHQLLAGSPHLTLDQLNLMAQRAATLTKEAENADPS